MATAGYSFDFKSSSSADGRSQSAFDNSGFNVSFGKGGVPGWVYAALVVGALWWIA